MNIEELIKLNPDFEFFSSKMTEDVKRNYYIKEYETGEIISHKSSELKYFGIITAGASRVINEFENGNIYMIETNPAIDYIGEVTILAQQKYTSVTIEASKPSTVFYIPRKTAEKWIFENVEILSRLTIRVANKLYRSSLENGMKLFYSSDYILIDYLVKIAAAHKITGIKRYKFPHTRSFMAEEIGMNLKTLNRTITKLKDKDLFFIEKGKIVMTLENYKNSQNYLDASKMN
ncbi:MAG: Crp/Fnr family transcriptional regulator [Gallicola sp.]|nr:Crp/Fnr family transcriptional regulator [Gallicola sp.]